MLGFLLRIVFAVIAVRFVAALVRAIAGPRDEAPRVAPPRESPPKPIVDRASAIDVPFTEERTEP